MRMSLVLLLLAGCGGPQFGPAPPRAEEVIPRYAILTTVNRGDSMFRSINWLANHRFGDVYRFSSVTRHRDQILEWLRRKQPSYVTLIVRPEELDANFQLAFLEIACRVDSDPFPDFAYGYLLAGGLDYLEHQMRVIQGVEERVDRKLRRATAARFDAEAPAVEEKKLAWADGIPLREIGVKADDVPGIRKRLADIEECDFLVLSGPSGPEAIAGLPSAELERMKLDSMAIFSASHQTGVVSAWYDASGGGCRRRSVPPADTFARKALGNGVPALFVPLHEADPAWVAREWADMILSNAPFGEVMKHTYDLAVLLRGGVMPSFVRMREGRALPDHPSLSAATRILYGDPILHAYERKSTPPVVQSARKESIGADGKMFLTLRYRVASTDCAPFFQDALPASQLIHLRTPLPPHVRRATVIFEGCTLDGRTVEAKMAVNALERWRGNPFVHLLIRGPNLAQEGLIIQFTLALE